MIRVRILEGGAGSGNFGHAGRVGKVGGSVPQNNIILSPEIRKELNRVNGLNLNLRSVDILKLMAIKDIKSKIISVEYTDMAITIKSMYLDVDGTVIATCERKLSNRNNVNWCEFISLEVVPNKQGRGFANNVYKHQLMVLKHIGFNNIAVQASGSIGRYAWAKKGFEYQNKTDSAYLEQQHNNFKRFLKQHIGYIPDNLPVFDSPNSYASYTIPGIKIDKDAIRNTAVLPGKYDIGQAFMLDTRGHGMWYGVLTL